MTNINKTLLGCLFGLLLASSIVYFVEFAEELHEIEEEPAKVIFFVIIAILHIVFVVLLLKRYSKVPLLVTLGGTIGLIILYGATRDDLGDVGELGAVSKTIQAGIVVCCLGLLFKK